MPKSQIFSTDRFRTIESQIVELLNSQPYYLTPATASSTRAAGDAIQGILSERFESILGDLCQEYSSTFARRAMADLAFTDIDGLRYLVDVKTHRLDTRFNMPNLTSVRRLASLYEDDRNHFVLLMVKYISEPTRITVNKVHFVPIEFLSWDCLTIGALGVGQIQIADANVLNIVPGYSRKRWMTQLCDVMLDFYPKEVRKIESRIDYFKRVKALWETRSEE